MTAKAATQQKCGFFTILGKPNAGKSTLLNQLVGAKVSIVTHKVQTTRNRVVGVAMEGESQLVFIDTPGIFSASRAFEKEMVSEAWAGVSGADAILVILDAKRGLDEETLSIIQRLQEGKAGVPVALVINKVDLVDKPYLLKLAEIVSTYDIFQQIFMVSALKADGVGAITKWLAGIAPEGPWHYPEDHLTDIPLRELAAEIAREKLFLLLNKELPYSLAVETESWEERQNGSVFIRQLISVEREGQKKIVIGKGGTVLKKVGMQTRKDLEEELGRKVHLELFVKVDPSWKERQLKNKRG